MSFPHLPEVKSIRSFPLEGTQNPLVVTQYQSGSIQVHIPDEVKDQKAARAIIGDILGGHAHASDAQQYSVVTANHEAGPESDALFTRLTNVLGEQGVLNKLMADQRTERSVTFGVDNTSTINVEYNAQSHKINLSATFAQKDSTDMYNPIRKHLSPEAIEQAFSGVKAKVVAEQASGARPFLSIEVTAAEGASLFELYEKLGARARESATLASPNLKAPWTQGGTQMGGVLDPQAVQQLITNVMHHDGQSPVSLEPAQAKLLRQLRDQLRKPAFAAVLG